MIQRSNIVPTKAWLEKSIIIPNDIPVVAKLTPSGHMSGQNGADFHMGTTNVPRLEQALACLITRVTKNIGWVHQHTSSAHETVNASTALESAPESTEKSGQLAVVICSEAVHCMRAPQLVIVSKRLLVYHPVIIVNYSAEVVGSLILTPRGPCHLQLDSMPHANFKNSSGTILQVGFLTAIIHNGNNPLVICEPFNLVPLQLGREGTQNVIHCL